MTINDIYPLNVIKAIENFFTNNVIKIQTDGNLFSISYCVLVTSEPEESDNSLIIPINNKDQLLTYLMAITNSTGKIFDFETIYQNLNLSPSKYLVLTANKT